MKFSYTALGKDSQKTTGQLEAESLNAARQVLHKMELSVVALSEISPIQNEANTQVPTQKKEKKEDASYIGTYYFLAKDAQGKEVNGTIDSKEAYLAYKRLISEYQFQVLDFYEHGAAAPEKATLKSNFETWNQRLQKEGVSPISNSKSSVKNELVDEGEALADEIVLEIDHFISNTKKILEEYKDQYSAQYLQDIEKALGNLERIRGSNNFNHINKVCNELYKLIVKPDLKKPGEGETEGRGYQEVVDKLKASGFVQNRFSLTSATPQANAAEGLQKVKGIFSKIQGTLDKNTEGLKSLKDNHVPVSELPLDEEVMKHPIKTLVSKYGAYLKEGNPIVKRSRKQEFDLFYRQWKTSRAQKKAIQIDSQKTPAGPAEKRDFSSVFHELNSFVGWLLFFYLAFFFMASFSLERNLGFAPENIIKTFYSPVIINVSILLVIAHFALTLKAKLFQKNFMGSAFLFFLTFGVYSLVIANF